MNHRQFASDVALLCDGLGIERAAFLGESTGSMLQLSLALNRPDLVAAAVLAGPATSGRRTIELRFVPAPSMNLLKTGSRNPKHCASSPRCIHPSDPIIGESS